MDFPIEFFNEYTSNSEEDTFNIGQYVASSIKATIGWKTKTFIIALSGELGSGKTALTKGIAAGFGITDCITSPTYTIISEYPLISEGILYNKENKIDLFTFYHIDAYRLNNEKEFEDIGGHEILSSNGVCVIEWSEKIKHYLPKETIYINIDFLLGDCRKIKISNGGNL